MGIIAPTTPSELISYTYTDGPKIIVVDKSPSRATSTYILYAYTYTYRIRSVVNRFIAFNGCRP